MQDGVYMELMLPCLRLHEVATRSSYDRILLIPKYSMRLKRMRLEDTPEKRVLNPTEVGSSSGARRVEIGKSSTIA